MDEKNSTQHPEILQKFLSKTLLAQPKRRKVTDRMGIVKTFEVEVINQGREKESPTFNKRRQELPGMKSCSPIKSTRVCKTTTKKLGVTKGRRCQKGINLPWSQKFISIPEDEGQIN